MLEEEGNLIAGWRAKFGEENQAADSFVFDVIIGASGKNCVMEGFSRYRQVRAEGNIRNYLHLVWTPSLPSR